MKKNLRNIITAALLLIFSTGCSAPAPEIGSKADMTGYEGLTDKTDHVFLVSDVNDFLTRLDNKETFVAYFGFDACPWCNNVISTLNDLGKEYNQTIYYINTRPNKKVTANNQIDKYDQLFQRIGEYWQYDEGSKENYLFVPYVIFIKEGNIIVSHMGSIDGYTYGITDLPTDQFEDLNQIYKAGFEKISQQS